jgi:hypothetical protein
MKLIQANEMAEWDNNQEPPSFRSIKRKLESFQHEAELMLMKLYDWQRRAPGKVYVTTIHKQGGSTFTKIPLVVSTNPNDYMSFSIIDTINNADGVTVDQLYTRVYVTKKDIPLVRTIRKLIDKHNDLTNKQAEFAGKFIGTQK